MGSCKPMWHCKYSVILESNVIFHETYMKMSKYENSLFPYSLHSTVNLRALHVGRKTQMLLQCLFSVYSVREMLSKLTKSVTSCQHPILWCNHQNWNLSFCNFLSKYELCIKDKELHDMEQKIYTNFFFITFQ